MTQSNPNPQKEYTCKKCGHTGPYILKMGGMLCAKCRVIMFYPESQEYLMAIEKSTRLKGR